MRPIQWHLKTNWKVPESLEKVFPIPRSLHPHLQWWLQEDNVLTGQPLHPIKHALQIFTDASTEGEGAHLNECTARGAWSLSGKQAVYQLPRTLSSLKSLSSLKRVLRPLPTQDSTCSNRQHHSGVIHKQGRRHEVEPTLCFTMEILDLVHHRCCYQLTRSLIGLDNEKDDMTSCCLDRKQIQCATWPVHSTGTGQLVETQDVFFWHLTGRSAPTGLAIAHWIGY